MSELWNLFIAFFRASNLAFGGGAAIIPLVQAEVITHYQWMTPAQFSDGLAIATSLPGPIATLLAGYVGYHVSGWLGVFAALLGTIGLTTVAVIFLTNFLMKHMDSPILKGALKGVRPVIVVLIAKTAFDMGANVSFNIYSLVIALFTIFALYKLKLHPGIIIILSMLFGIIVF
ncbi:chromate transporter [Desulfitobacterium sp.]|uniref:chromate transporter n=1 Tax=Desulfitobacterium sp. TaxID=49981 RepID=UPI002B21AA02|nr:chromate transporter [Desulfitobacterium sp.]MEA4902085.1 chromate transporter [Desulfitobacterium sp.]